MIIKGTKYIARNLISRSKKLLLTNSVYAYWWNRNRNFGDILNPMLFRHYAINLVYVHINKAELISIGSIITHLANNKNYSGYIIGSGLISDTVIKLPQAKILAVRGPLTANRIDAPGDVILGDPGLLVSELIDNRQSKKFKLGIIPHFSDKQQQSVLDFYKKHKEEINLIDIQSSPKNFIEEVDKCNYIISSSLHGLITADSLGIPNIRFKTSTDSIGGGEFKYNDYNLSIDKSNEYLLLNKHTEINEILSKSSINYSAIGRRKDDLTKLFTQLKDIIF